MLCGNVVTRFANNAEDAQTITDLVEDIRDALMDYQVGFLKVVTVDSTNTTKPQGFSAAGPF